MYTHTHTHTHICHCVCVCVSVCLSVCKLSCTLRLSNRLFYRQNTFVGLIFSKRNYQLSNQQFVARRERAFYSTQGQNMSLLFTNTLCFMSLKYHYLWQQASPYDGLHRSFVRFQCESHSIPGQRSSDTQHCNTQTGIVTSATRCFTKLNSLIPKRSEQTAIRYECFWLVRKIAKGDYQFRYVFVLPSIHMEKLGFHCTDFHEILNWYIFRNFLRKIQIQLKSDKNIVYFTRSPT